MSKYKVWLLHKVFTCVKSLGGDRIEMLIFIVELTHGAAFGARRGMVEDLSESYSTYLFTIAVLRKNVHVSSRMAL